MALNGQIWLYKSHDNKLNLKDLQKSLEDLNAQKLGSWDVAIHNYSNDSGSFRAEKKNSIWTIADSLLPNNIGVFTSEKKEKDGKDVSADRFPIGYSFKGSAETVILNLGLKIMDSYEISGTTYRISDFLISIGTVSKLNSMGKELIVRVEFQAWNALESIDPESYKSLGLNLLDILGSSIKNSLVNDSTQKRVTELLQHLSEKRQRGKTCKWQFDQMTLGLLYSNLFNKSH